LCPVLTDVRFIDEELSTKVFFGDVFMIDDCDRVDTGEDEVLCDFIRECFDANEKDVCFSNTACLSVYIQPWMSRLLTSPVPVRPFMSQC
jgi:hypothetical protein